MACIPLKIPRIFPAFGFHLFVPKGKAEPEVEAELGMMQAMMSCANKPTAKPVLVKALWIYFNIGVIDGTGQGQKGDGFREIVFVDI